MVNSNVWDPTTAGGLAEKLSGKTWQLVQSRYGKASINWDCNYRSLQMFLIQGPTRKFGPGFSGMWTSFQLPGFFYSPYHFNIMTFLVVIHHRLEAHICCFLFEIGSIGSLWVQLVWWKTAWSSGKKMSSSHFSHKMYVSHLVIRRCYKNLIA